MFTNRLKNLLIASVFTVSTIQLTQAQVVEDLQPTQEFQTNTAIPKFQVEQPLGLKADANAVQLAQSTAINQSYQSTAWFQSVDLTLKRDYNGNGFFSRLYIRFDANTEYTRQPAYAVYSLINQNGYETIFYTSSIFNLFDVSSQDWFAIETNLDRLPRGLYKLRIQLKDAQTGFNLAEISGYDTASLDRMALEDVYSDDTVTYYEESGGSVGVFSLLGLSFLYMSRRRKLVAQNSTLLH